MSICEYAQNLHPGRQLLHFTIMRKFSMGSLLLLLIGAAALLLWPHGQEVVGQTLSAFGEAQISGPVQVDLSLTPAIVTPGEQMLLQIEVTNFTTAEQIPQLTLQLPAGLAADRALFPAGMTMNVAENRLDWAPVAGANGGMVSLTLPLATGTADIAAPEKQIGVSLESAEGPLTAFATLWVGVAPQIDQIWHPPQVAVGQPFQLRGDVSGSGPVTRVWHMGDGRRLNVESPTILYSAPGIYTVELEAGNPLSSVTRTTEISVVPHPAAQFAPDDLTPGVGQTVTFLNQSGGEQPLSFQWDFGDGAVSSEAMPAHAYTAPGTYQVHLTVANGYGQSEAFWQVQVGEPPRADLLLPESLPLGETAVGAASGDTTVTGFSWEMGDGTQYEGAAISHTYTESGSYYVTLTANNEFGGVQVGRWIEITPGTLSIFLPWVVNGTGEATAFAELEAVLGDLELPSVDLEAPFVLAPLALPAEMSPVEQLFVYINEARRQFELPALTFNPQLTTAAQQHAAEMAAFGYTAHTGIDGSTPAERLLLFDYRAGYAGEATAWGFQMPYQAVEFWVNSPPHRRIILNAAATEVGVGFTQNYSAPNVWYWTAEFGNAFGAPTQPVLRLGEPAAEYTTMVTQPVVLSWNWPVSLAAGEQFEVVLHTNQGAFTVAEISEPVIGTRYEAVVTAVEMTSRGTPLLVQPGAYSWQIVLRGSQQLESEKRTILFQPDPNMPTVTPTPAPLTPTATPLPATITATPQPTATIPVIGTPLPPTPTNPPPLVTATPSGG
jgi:PKD repeat protein